MSERSPAGPRGTVTVLLRLVAPAVADGRFVGHAEVVDTGEVAPISDLADLVMLVRRLGEWRPPAERVGGRVVGRSLDADRIDPAGDENSD